MTAPVEATKSDQAVNELSNLIGQLAEVNESAINLSASQSESNPALAGTSQNGNKETAAADLKPTTNVGQSDSQDQNAMAAMLAQLMKLVLTMTNTLQVIQMRFKQLSDQETALAKQIQDLEGDDDDDDKTQQKILEYQAQLQDVQNQQSLAQQTMTGASSSESTMMQLLGDTVKNFITTLTVISQNM